MACGKSALPDPKKLDSTGLGCQCAVPTGRTAGVFVYSIATGEGALADTWSSFFGNVNDQARCSLCADARRHSSP